MVYDYELVILVFAVVDTALEVRGQKDHFIKYVPKRLRHPRHHREVVEVELFDQEQQ